MRPWTHGGLRWRELRCRFCEWNRHHYHILYNSKDVRLPVQLQRAMAAEAEAAREARARVSGIWCCIF